MKKRYSPLVRTICGVLGGLGFVAIAFNAVQEDGIRISFSLMASTFAGFIFLYVAFFGVSPLDFSTPKDHDE